MDTNWQTMQQWGAPPPFEVDKESKLKLSLETRNWGDVMIVHCHGRIVYRDEAAALSRLVGQLLQRASKVILDLSGVDSIDSAGIGDLALLHTWAQDRDANLKIAGPNTLVQNLLDLTNLDSVLDVYPTLDSALAAFRDERICADC